MQELCDKTNVSYGYMYKYIWPELKKDNRLIENCLRGSCPDDGHRYNIGVVVHKTIDTLIADMIRVLGLDEQTARDTVADLIRNKDKLTVAV